ncbi:MAG: hypothetical protein K0R31_1627 [Clostridiales bacterium]|jgi:hypothetical protein|nr:hypothetical protein [Clostridiales bacterium]
MNEKKRDQNIVKEAIGDPSFYNDQITQGNEPIKAVMKDNKNEKSKLDHGFSREQLK